MYRWCSLQNGYGTGDNFVVSSYGFLCLNTGPDSACFGNGNGYPGAYVVVQNDGHVVEYNGLVPVWQAP